jgi:hypothetical protein
MRCLSDRKLKQFCRKRLGVKSGVTIRPDLSTGLETAKIELLWIEKV